MKISRNLVVMLIVGQSVFAQTVAKYAGEYLSIGVGGRALGLGGSYVALANDASGGYWNPAALARINYPEVMLMHDERFGSLLNYDFGAIAIPYSCEATLGISAMRLGVDGIPDTRDAGVDVNGNPVPRDQYSNAVRQDYNKIVYFNSADWAIYLTYAWRSSSGFMYGVNLKVLRRILAEFSATGVGFDLGVLYSPKENWFIAANVQDITTTLIAWSNGTNELISPTIKLGTAYSFEILSGRFTPTLDADVRFENRRFASIANLGPISIDPHTGLEYDFKNTIALRIGYSDVKQLTLGAGFHLRKIDIDYSFARFGKDDNLGNTHRISLRLVMQDERYARVSE